MRRCILFSLLLVAAHIVQGQAYYVSNTGTDDSEGGDEAAPWKTIAFAVGEIQSKSGNIGIFIADGTYEIDPIIIENPSWSGLTFTNFARQGGGVTIKRKSDDNSEQPLFTINDATVTFRNLIFDGTISQTEKATQAIAVSGEGAGLRMNLCEVLNFTTGLGLISVSAIVTGCIFDNNTTGVQVASEGGGGGSIGSTTVIINTNSFTNNDQAIANGSGVTINAESNWWGGALRATVRSAIGLEPDAVSGNTDYSPWLANDEDEGTFGFDPPANMPRALGVDSDSPTSNAGPGTPLNLQAAYDQAGSGGTLFLAGGTPFPSLAANADGATVLSTETSDAQVTIEDLTINISVAPDEGDTLRLAKGKLLISNFLTISAGNLETTLDSSQVILGDGITTTSTELNAKLIGDFTTTPRSLGEASTLNILGVEIGAGAALANLTINRINGEGSAITVGENQSINSKWIINADQTALDPGRNLAFSWLPQNDNGKAFDTSDAATLWRSEEGTAWELIPIDDQAFIEDGLRSVSANNITNFSTWTVSDVNSPLPVTLTDFTARLDESSARLQWVTASEINADYFSIERSTDGQTYQPLGRRQAAGNSQTEQTYTYVDEGVANRLAGTVYYRLHMVDFDGSSEYSPVVGVSLESASDLLVYADRGGTFKLFASLPEATYTVQVSDMLGNIVYEAALITQPEVREYALSVPTLVQSVYTLRCLGASDLHVRKFRVE